MCKKLVITFLGILLLVCPIPTFAQETLYTEDFEMGVAKNWDLERGWRVEQEEGNFVLSGEGNSWARFQRGQNWTNYSLRLRLKLIRGAIHLNYRVSEKGRYFIGLREEGLYLNKEAPWREFFELARSDVRLSLNSWHIVEIVGERGHLQVYVDDTLQIDYIDDAPLTQGSIVFETLEDSYAHLDDVKVAFEFREAPPVSIVERELSHERVARVVVPVFMYYVERYLLDIPDKTEIDMDIKSILDESLEGQKFIERAFESYKTIPDEMKFKLFDAVTVEWTSLVTEPLNLDLIRNRVNEVKPNLTWEAEGPPAAPSGLVAKNISQFEPVKYQIELKWQDNSGDEDGFLIYRAFKGAGGNPQQIASVGPNVTTFVDPLTKPAVKDDQYCYQVLAYKISPIALAGQPPEQLKSSPSNAACSYYCIGFPPPPPLPDWDGDGIPDQYDKCPKQHAGQAIWTEGCPDVDGDGVPDNDDKCPLVWGEKQDGCPLKYNLRWMGMKILNNSGVYAYPDYKFVDKYGKSKGLYDNEGPDKFAYGEEPYLFFAWTNGMTAKGMLEHGATRWCCGECVDVKKGEDYEPDNDGSGEEYPLKLNDLQDHGLTVFPAVAGNFAEIDDKLGFAMTVTLMERDWTATITPEDQASALEAAFKIGGAVVGAVSSCVGTGGFGCLVSVGGAMKTTIETLFGLSNKPTPTTVTDPDDFQGTAVWAITRTEAKWRTSNSGAYAFYFNEMPIPYDKSCLGWEPCGPGVGVPITMRARLYFCLYQEGTPESEIKKACSSYQMVFPWPMQSP